MQVTGLRPDANGRLPEYYRALPDGQAISYDGMTVRSDVEVYQETKNGWDELAFHPTSPDMVAELDKWIRQAQTQLDARPPGAVLEWHLCDPHAAAAVQQAFARPGLGLQEVVVLYTPKL